MYRVFICVESVTYREKEKKKKKKKKKNSFILIILFTLFNTHTGNLIKIMYSVVS